MKDKQEQLVMAFAFAASRHPHEWWATKSACDDTNKLMKNEK